MVQGNEGGPQRSRKGLLFHYSCGMENLEPLQQLCLQWGKSLYIKSATNRVHNPYSGVLLPAGPK